MYQDVLDFWFKEISPAQRFMKDAAFDEKIRQRFGKTLEQAAVGELFGWRKSAKGRLAEIIVLDQFSRNLYRDTPRAFAQDAMALALTQEAVAAGALTKLQNEDERTFLLMPYMHSESTLLHEIAVLLFKQFASENGYEYELKHKAIIDRFGRYPHRNDVLQRESSVAETEFLQQPGSSF